MDSRMCINMRADGWVEEVACRDGEHQHMDARRDMRRDALIKMEPRGNKVL